jgi:hypothetical protein
MNALSNIPTSPSADFKAVVGPNFETLYSSARLELPRVSIPKRRGQQQREARGLVATRPASTWADGLRACCEPQTDDRDVDRSPSARGSRIPMGRRHVLHRVPQRRSHYEFAADASTIRRHLRIKMPPSTGIVEFLRRTVATIWASYYQTHERAAHVHMRILGGALIAERDPLKLVIQRNDLIVPKRPFGV